MSWASSYLVKEAIGNRAARRLFQIYAAKPEAEKIPFLRRIGLGSQAGPPAPDVPGSFGQGITSVMHAEHPIGVPVSPEYRRYLSHQLPLYMGGSVNTPAVRPAHIHGLMNTAIQSRYDPWSRSVRRLQGGLESNKLRRHPIVIRGPAGSETAFALNLPVPPKYRPIYFGGAAARNPHVIRHERNEAYGARSMPGPFPIQSRGFKYFQGEPAKSWFGRLIARLPLARLATDQHRGFDVPLRDLYASRSGLGAPNAESMAERISLNLIRHRLGAPYYAPEGGRAFARAIRRADALLPRDALLIGRTAQPLLDREFAKRLAIARSRDPSVGDIPIQFPERYHWDLRERLMQRLPYLILGGTGLVYGMNSLMEDDR